MADRRQPHRGVIAGCLVAGVVAGLVAGCAGGRPSASPGQDPAASPEPTAIATEPASPPVASTAEPSPTDAATPLPSDRTSLSVTAWSEKNGVRVEIELQRNPMPAGEPSWVKVSVTNVGTDDLTWLHDSCASVAGVAGASAVAWPMGLEHDKQPQMFKTYALGGSIVDDISPYAYATFVPERLLGRGSYGCADIGIAEAIHPGEQRRETRWWTGFDARTHFLPPAGPVTLGVSADLFWRGQEPGDTLDGATRVVFDVPAWITAPDAIERLSPGQVIDAALGDPDFAAYVETQEIANGREEIAWYQADRDIWEIGIMPWYETTPPRIHGVTVDAVTGAVLGVLDRPWDKATEPFP